MCCARGCSTTASKRPTTIATSSPPSRRADCRSFAPIPTSSSIAASNSSIARARWRRPIARLGGETVVIGKPYRTIYEAALAAARSRRPDIGTDRILAIGDAVATDLKGAEACGLDALFVAGGIHRADINGEGFSPDVFKTLQAPPRYWIDALRP